MKKRIFYLLIPALFVLFFVPIFNLNIAKADQTNNDISNKTAEEIVDGMSQEQQICQTFFMYFQRWNGSSFTKMNDEVKDILNKYNFGGVVYFEPNCDTTTQTLQLSKDIQKESLKDASAIPLLITIDQEGGRVVRLKSGTSMPGNMGLGATFDTNNSYINGDIIGSELHSLAINTDYSPVVDVNNNANNPVIAIRSFGDDAKTVAENGVQYQNGLNKNNIASCAKHFPGHGDTATDSHSGLPCIYKNLEELEKNELVPFKALINNGVDMIMSAHIQYPEIEKEQVPSKDDPQVMLYKTATISHTILTDILKGKMGFDGVISTDGMHMAGITKFYNEPQACYEALKAGVDMMCGPVSGTNKTDWYNSFNAIMSYLKEKCNSEPEFAERIKDAATRVVKLKQKRGVLNYKESDYPEQTAINTVGSKQHRDTERDIAAKSVTVAKNNNNTLPIHLNEKSKLLFLCQNNNIREDMSAQMALGWNRAKQAGLIPDGATVNCEHFDKDNYKIEGKIKDAIDNADTVIINSMLYNSSQMTYKSWQTAGVQNAVEYCKTYNKKSIVISNFFPYDAQLYPNADAIMSVYNAKGSYESYQNVIDSGKTMPDKTFGPSTIAGIEVAFGVYGATGKFPVNIPKFDVGQSKYTDEIVYPRGYGIQYDPTTFMDKVSAKAEVSEIEYDGTPKKPKIICVTDQSNKTLEEGKDYKVEYFDNINIGNAKAVVTGVGSYVGQKTVEFKIVEAKQPVDPSSRLIPTNHTNENSTAQTSDTNYLFVVITIIMFSISTYITFKKMKNSK